MVIVDKQAWDKIYREKGEYFEKVIGVNSHKEMPKLAKIFAEKGFENILDLGCGTGRNIVYFAEKGFKVWGTDISITAIKTAKLWLKEKKLSATLKLHDMTKKPPFKDDFFDAVISIQVIHHGKIEDIRKTIAEIARVIKKGGLVFISVPIYKGPITGVKKGSWTFEKIATRTYVPLDGPEKGMPHYFFRKKELEREFKKFKIEETYFDNTNHYCLLAYKK